MSTTGTISCGSIIRVQARVRCRQNSRHRSEKYFITSDTGLSNVVSNKINTKNLHNHVLVKTVQEIRQYFGNYIDMGKNSTRIGQTLVPQSTDSEMRYQKHTREIEESLKQK